MDEPLGNPVDSFWTNAGCHVMHILYRDMHRVMHNIMHKCHASDMEGNHVATVWHDMEPCEAGSVKSLTR